jgi:hypothetical protein
MRPRKRNRNKLSEQARERIRLGRPAKYPEAKILMQRAEVSRIHAYLVASGKRRSRPLEAMLAGIRAEMAAIGKAAA